MNYRQLGRSGLRVSELCLGTMNFGPRTSEADSFGILDAAVDAGINFIDTANQYGGNLGVGTTETILGRWLEQHRSLRDKLVIATKFCTANHRCCWSEGRRWGRSTRNPRCRAARRTYGSGSGRSPCR